MQILIHQLFCLVLMVLQGCPLQCDHCCLERAVWKSQNCLLETKISVNKTGKMELFLKSQDSWGIYNEVWECARTALPARSGLFVASWWCAEPRQALQRTLTAVYGAALNVFNLQLLEVTSNNNAKKYFSFFPLCLLCLPSPPSAQFHCSAKTRFFSSLSPGPAEINCYKPPHPVNYL